MSRGLSLRISIKVLMIVLFTTHRLCDAQLERDSENESDKFTTQERLNSFGTAVGIILGLFAISVCLPFCIVFIVMCLVCRYGGVSPGSKEESGTSTTGNASSTYATTVTVDRPQDSAHNKSLQASKTGTEKAEKSTSHGSTRSKDTSRPPQPAILPSSSPSLLRTQTEITVKQEGGSSLEPASGESEYQEQPLYYPDTKTEDPLVTC